MTTRYAFALIESGARSTSIGEPVAGPDVMSPRHYRKYAQPQEKRMVDDLKAKGIILHNHICGNTIPIINDFIATGAQVLEIDHKTDMRKAKDAGRGKTCFLGTIDTAVLATGTPRRGRGRLPRGDRDHGAGGRVHPGAGLRAGDGDAGREHPRAGGSGAEVRKILIQRGGYPCPWTTEPLTAAERSDFRRRFDARLAKVAAKTADAFAFRDVKAPPYIVNSALYWVFGLDPDTLPDDYVTDPAVMTAFQERTYYDQVKEIDDDFVPYLMPWYGTIVTASALGCQIEFQPKMDPAANPRFYPVQTAEDVNACRSPTRSRTG